MSRRLCILSKLKKLHDGEQDTDSGDRHKYLHLTTVFFGVRVVIISGRIVEVYPSPHDSCISIFCEAMTIDDPYNEYCAVDKTRFYLSLHARPDPDI